VGTLLRDLLVLRRSMTLEIITIATPRIPPGGTRLPRAALARAWSSRDEPQLFVREDFDITRSLVEQAQFYPALWLLNRIAEVYLEISSAVSGALAPPADYRSAHEALFDAIEQGDVNAARSIYSEYMDRHDQRLLATMEAFSRGAALS
jgi:DNA-binding FadR family transcriptional regulator